MHHHQACDDSLNAPSWAGLNRRYDHFFWLLYILLYFAGMDMLTENADFSPLSCRFEVVVLFMLFINYM